MVFCVKISPKPGPFSGSSELAKNTSQSVVIGIASVGVETKSKETVPQTTTRFRQHDLVKFSRCTRAEFKAQRQNYTPSFFRVRLLCSCTAEWRGREYSTTHIKCLLLQIHTSSKAMSCFTNNLKLAF